MNRCRRLHGQHPDSATASTANIQIQPLPPRPTSKPAVAYTSKTQIQPAPRPRSKPASSAKIQTSLLLHGQKRNRVEVIDIIIFIIIIVNDNNNNNNNFILVLVIPLVLDLQPGYRKMEMQCMLCDDALHKCPDNCPRGAFENENEFLAVFRWLNQCPLIPSFFRNKQPEECPQISLSLLWEAAAWHRNIVSGPHGLYEMLEDLVLSLVERGVSEEPPENFLFDPNEPDLQFHFDPVGFPYARDPRRRACLYHSLRQKHCPGNCILKYAFPPNDDNVPFFARIDSCFKGGHVPAEVFYRFFNRLMGEDQENRRETSRALFWEQECWRLHPLRGPLGVYRDLQRRYQILWANAEENAGEVASENENAEEIAGEVASWEVASEDENAEEIAGEVASGEVASQDENAEEIASGEVDGECSEDGEFAAQDLDNSDFCIASKVPIAWTGSQAFTFRVLAEDTQGIGIEAPLVLLSGMNVSEEFKKVKESDSTMNVPSMVNVEAPQKKKECLEAGAQKFI